MDQPVSAIVLAGGASRRMGFDKATAEWADGRTLLGHVVEILAALSDDVVVVANEADPHQVLPVRNVADIYHGSGSLGGLHAGLVAAHYGHCIAVACDMPLLNPALWRFMLGLPRDFDVLMPRVSGQNEPLHAVYSKACIPHIEQALRKGDYRMLSFHHPVKVRFLDEDQWEPFDREHRSFCNVNTPKELARARMLLETAEPW